MKQKVRKYNAGKLNSNKNIAAYLKWNEAQTKENKFFFCISICDEEERRVKIGNCVKQLITLPWVMFILVIVFYFIFTFRFIFSTTIRVESFILCFVLIRWLRKRVGQLVDTRMPIILFAEKKYGNLPKLSPKMLVRNLQNKYFFFALLWTNSRFILNFSFVIKEVIACSLSQKYFLIQCAVLKPKTQ